MNYSGRFQSTVPRPATLKSRAYEHIREMLFDGRLKEGDHLSPIELGNEIGISHIPVREAINHLASEGLVVQIARQGAFVRHMERRELLELIELRGMLEAATITKVAKRIKLNELEELEGYLKVLEQLVAKFWAAGKGGGEDTGAYEEQMVALMSEWMLTDLSFHMLLMRVGGNRQVANFMAEREVMLQMFRHRTDSPAAWKRPLAKYYEENYQLHKDIYEAVKDGDPKSARRAMIAHTRRVEKNMLARFDWLQRQKDADAPLARDFPDSMRRLVQDIQSRFMKDDAKKERG